MARKKYPKPPSVTLVMQLIELKIRYPKLIEDVRISNGQLTCIMWIQPTVHSIRYKIKFTYKMKMRPHAWLLYPPAEKYKGKYPHHKYGFDDLGHMELCFFYPKGGEWNSTMYLADAVVPWISTWLFAYEVWLVTGNWCYPESNKAKDNKSEHDSDQKEYDRVNS